MSIAQIHSFPGIYVKKFAEQKGEIFQTLIAPTTDTGKMSRKFKRIALTCVASQPERSFLSSENHIKV